MKGLGCSSVVWYMLSKYQVLGPVSPQHPKKRRVEILMHAVVQVILKHCAKLNKQSQKVEYCVIPLI